MLVSFMAKSATETKGLIVCGTKSHCMQLKRLFEILATFLLQISWQSFLLKLKSLELLMSLRLHLHFSLKNEHVPANHFQRHGSQRQPHQPGCPNSYMPELFESP